MLRSLTALAAVAFLFPPCAFATHAEPTKAKKVQFSLVNGFAACSSPNTTMQANGLDACAPPSDPFGSFGCAFTSAGSGKMSLALTGTNGTEDVKISATASGIAATCENHALCISLNLRLTNDDCAEGSCTAVDLQNFKLFSTCCMVTNGKCNIKTTLLTAEPGFLPQGKNTGIEVLGCGLAQDLPVLADPSITCGVLLK